ncbi:hypothetical protein [Aquabacterium sp. J223]|uniref:hypothetical protein n=1 Tax=Aquabacterium sp. J223 TaxID=2898431 RepID=UPI0021AD8AE0|nr:hypothetical protein [Aquabacterium sp. J223]UUX97175.1 hypothetical protein LRS07_08015 [Aquabacterium sp. J223]
MTAWVRVVTPRARSTPLTCAFTVGGGQAERLLDALVGLALQQQFQDRSLPRGEA